MSSIVVHCLMLAKIVDAAKVTMTLFLEKSLSVMDLNLIVRLFSTVMNKGQQ